MKNTNRGSFEIWLDDALLTTIDANNTTLAWQQTYTSPTLADGNHILNFKYAGPAGKYFDVDSIQTFGPPDLTAPAAISPADSGPRGDERECQSELDRRGR